MSFARRNIFQQLVRGWEKLHPYNGAQVLHICGAAPDAGLVAYHWHRTLTDLGVGCLAPGVAGGETYGLVPPVAAVPVTCLPLRADLDAHLSAGLNAAFSDGEPILRPFLLPGENSFHVGVCYRHWLADSVAIRMVLEEFFNRLVLGRTVRSRALDLAEEGYRGLFGPAEVGGPLDWALLPALVDSARQSWRMKRVCRVEGAGVDDHRVGFSRHRPRAETIGRIVGFARGHGVKVNDVLVGALAVAVGRHGPMVRTRHRRDFAFGSIVDLRSSGHQDLSNTFGLFLGFTTVIVRGEDFGSGCGVLSSDDFAGVVAAVGGQHATGRANRAAAASMIRMGAGVAVGRMFGAARELKSFYRKRFPLAGGVSNVNLSSGSLAAHHPHLLLDFIRVSPTGPMMPLVISATTLDDSFHFGLTHRISVVPESMAETIGADVVRQLESL